ncbi:MAG TPA: hypothetical protein VF210_00760 [Pseudomonadales bacterium]
MHARPDIGIRKLVLLAWAAALMAIPDDASAQAITEMEIVEPRTFGHVVGDTLRREVFLTLDPDYRLDPDSVPEAGRIDRWIERAEPQLTMPSLWQRGRYHLVLTYRILDAPPSVRTIALPQENLRIVGRDSADAHVRTTLVPTLRIDVSPLTAAAGPDDVTPSALQPDRPPAPIPLEPRQRRLAWTGAGLLALLMIGAWQRGVRSWVERRQLPFARAVRALKRSRPDEAGLKIVHDAINRTAGRAIFTHNLDDFVATHAEYAALRDDLHRLFAASDQAFFRESAPPGNGAPDLLELCRHARRIERRTYRARTARRSAAEQPG